MILGSLRSQHIPWAQHLKLREEKLSKSRKCSFRMDDCLCTIPAARGGPLCFRPVMAGQEQPAELSNETCCFSAGPVSSFGPAEPKLQEVGTSFRAEACDRCLGDAAASPYHLQGARPGTERQHKSWCCRNVWPASFQSPVSYRKGVFCPVALWSSFPSGGKKRVLGSQAPCLAMARMGELLGTTVGNSKARGLWLTSEAHLRPTGIPSPTPRWNLVNVPAFVLLDSIKVTHAETALERRHEMLH